MSSGEIFTTIVLIIISPLYLWTAYKGWKTGAVDIMVKGAAKPVLAYRDSQPFKFWIHVISYVAVSLALPLFALYLFVF
jgi:hypothetical protein